MTGSFVHVFHRAIVCGEKWQLIVIRVCFCHIYFTVKNGALLHWFKYNTLGCCSGFHSNFKGDVFTTYTVKEQGCLTELVTSVAVRKHTEMSICMYKHGDVWLKTRGQSVSIQVASHL